MSLPILKLALTLDQMTKEVHPKYGESYSFPVSGVAGFNSTGINVETADGKLCTMRFFNRPTEEVQSNGKPVYVPAVAIKEVKATLPTMLKAQALEVLSKVTAEKAALEARLAAMEERFALMMGAGVEGTFDTASVVKTKK